MVPRGHKRKRADAAADAPAAHDRRANAYGQRAFIPLDAVAPGDGISAEALAYLLSVRSEAAQLPDVLVAQRSGGPADTGTRRAHGGRYSDGAFVGEDSDDDDDDDDEDYAMDGDGSDMYDMEDAQDPLSDQEPLPKTISAAEAHHRRLLARLDNLRRRLQQVAQRDALAAYRRPTWRAIASGRPPLLAGLAAVPQHSALAALETVATNLTGSLLQDETRSHPLAAWVFGLLARVDPATLDSAEVSILRELGRRAGAIALGVATGGEAAQGSSARDEAEDEPDEPDDEYDKPEDEPDDEPDDFRERRNSSSVDEDGSDGDSADNFASELAMARSRLSNGADQTAPAGQVKEPMADSMYRHQEHEQRVGDTETAQLRRDETALPLSHPALDMIISIVGEDFGQRDLLAARQSLWPN